MEQANQKPNTPSYDGSLEPTHLYKYCSFTQYTERIFAHNEIYFPSPDKFNDPFDSSVHYTYEGTQKQRRAYLVGHYEALAPHEPRQKIKRHVNEILRKGEDLRELKSQLKNTAARIRTEIGVCSLAGKMDSILMWAHYAKQHTGFCLEFDAHNRFFQRALKVAYAASLPVLNTLKISTYTPAQIAETLLTKAEDWKYEQEWRIVDHRTGPGIQVFPDQALTAVVMGCRIAQENKERIIKWCKCRRHPPVLYLASQKQKC
ncbi:MAG: DUF2971 domain-containing protein [Planctomycetota bacterium]